MVKEVKGYQNKKSGKVSFQKQGSGLVFCIIRSAIESNGSY
jgi:hypothetical protein